MVWSELNTQPQNAKFVQKLITAVYLKIYLVSIVNDVIHGVMVSIIGFWSTDPEFESWPSHIFSLYFPQNETKSESWPVNLFPSVTKNIKIVLLDFSTTNILDVGDFIPAPL